MKPINTLYNGNYFRSRLEAKWAVFFDELGVPYQYEPEGFENESGDRYLPDFYLPETYLRMEHYGKGVYIEIKPNNCPNDDIPQSAWFTKNLILFIGMPHENIWGIESNSYNEGGYQLHPGWDNYMGFWMCQNCYETKIEFAEGNYDECPICGKRVNNYEALKLAAIKSIKKRFEHNAL